MSQSALAGFLLLTILCLPPTPALAQLTADTTLTGAIESLKHVAGSTTDKVTIKVSVFNAGTTPIPTDLVHVDVIISDDEILDANDDMILQKTLTAQRTENAEKKGRPVTTVTLDAGQTETIKLQARNLPAVQGLFAILSMGTGDDEAGTLLVQQIGQAGCTKHTRFLTEAEPNDDEAQRRGKIKLGQCLGIAGEMGGSDRLDRFFTVPAGADQQQLDIRIDSEATFTLSVDLLTGDTTLEHCTDTRACRVNVSPAVDRIDLTIMPEDELQAGGYTINITSGALDPPVGAQNVVINEVFPDASQVELRNRASSPVDVSGFWLCHTTPALIYTQMPPGTVIPPGGFVIVHWGLRGTNTVNDVFTFPNIPIPMNIPHGEFALYVPFPFAEENFADSALIVDYVQWGEAEHFRENVATGANIWPPGQFVPAPEPGQSLSWNGNGDTPDAWTSTTPTLGSDNSTQ